MEFLTKKQIADKWDIKLSTFNYYINENILTEKPTHNPSGDSRLSYYTLQQVVAMEKTLVLREREKEQRKADKRQDVIREINQHNLNLITTEKLIRILSICRHYTNKAEEEVESAEPEQFAGQKRFQ